LHPLDAGFIKKPVLCTEIGLQRAKWFVVGFFISRMN